MNSNSLKATRDGFGQALLELGNSNPSIVALCGDLTESLKLKEFAQSFPERFFEMGVQEENMVGIAAGLALTGLKPFAASYAAFCPANALGPLRASVCYSNLPVVIVGGHAGLVTGPDGATHQALEDLAIMQSLPNMTVVVPADAHQAYQATLALADHQGPAYLRLSKHSVPVMTEQLGFELGKAQTLVDGTDLTIIVTGTLLDEALKARAELVDEGISTRVINVHTLKPLDTQTIREAAEQTGHIITLEDHQVFGGLGSAITQYLCQNELGNTSVHCMGVQDSFGESGSAQELLELHKLTAEHITNQAIELIKGSSK